MLHTENNCQKALADEGLGEDLPVGGELARILGREIDERFRQVGIFAGADGEH